MTKLLGVATLGLVGLGVGAVSCGVRPPPPHYQEPDQPGNWGEYHCAARPTPAKVVTKLRLGFDDASDFWHGLKHGRVGSADLPAAVVAPRWSPDQKAILAQGRITRLSSVVPIGGDYFKETRYPVVSRSRVPWFSTGFAADDEGQKAIVGTLQETIASKVFRLDGDVLSVPIGGSLGEPVGVELWVKPKDGVDLSSCGGDTIAGKGKVEPPNGFVPALVVRPRGEGPSYETMAIEDVPLASPHCSLTGLEAVVRIVDASPTAHVNVGAIELLSGEGKGEGEHVPLWGFADFHTHPFNNLGLGGLQEVHTLWGAPGGAMTEYLPSDHSKAIERISLDVPPCDDPHMPFNAHHGGYSAPTMINAAEGRIAASLQDLGDPLLASRHFSQGGPIFADFPDFRRGAHHQHHITQIYRAYLGGLRLMSALAIHDEGLEYGSGWVRCGEDGAPRVDTTPDWTVVRAHATAMKQLAQLNDAWMEIAYTPADARRIVGENKLAVVLGVEVPRLGEEGDGSPAAQVDELYRLGIRQVVMVHGMDNALGGPALFQDLYNSVNDWMHRRPKDRHRVETLSGLLDWRQFDEGFYRITTDPTPFARVPGWPTEPIQFRLANPSRIVLSDVLPRPGRFSYSIPFTDLTFGVLHTLINTTPLFAEDEGPYDRYRGGHRNRRGLTARGAEFLEHLMRRGMLVDLAHMGEKTLDGMFKVTERECKDYPLMVSHAHFRALSLGVDYSDRGPGFVYHTAEPVKWFLDSLAKSGKRDDVTPMSACIQDHSVCDRKVYKEALLATQAAPNLGPGTLNRQFLGREYDIPSSVLYEVNRRGGAVGAFTDQGHTDANRIPAELRSRVPGLNVLSSFSDDCEGSSKGLATALLFASAVLQPTQSGQSPIALGLASDFTMVGNTAPRFGPNACAGYLGAGSGSASGSQLLETMLDEAKYQFKQQRDGVVYAHSRADGATTPSGRHATWLRCSTDSHPEWCGSNEPLDPYVMGKRTYNFNVDGLAHLGLVPDQLQDVANVLGEKKDLALNRVFASAEGYVAMWERACALSVDGCRDVPEARKKDDQCGKPWLRRECGNACPCSFNHGAPMQQVAQDDAVCDPGKVIRFPVVDGSGRHTFAAPMYQQRSTKVGEKGDLTEQGDWAIYPIGAPQVWTCGNDKPEFLECPSAANYVLVRRVLDTTVSPLTEQCDNQPLPPEAGNRRVVFSCLVGPPVGVAR